MLTSFSRSFTSLPQRTLNNETARHWLRQEPTYLSSVVGPVDGTSKCSLGEKMESAAEALLCKDAAALGMNPAVTDLCLEQQLAEIKCFLL